MSRQKEIPVKEMDERHEIAKAYVAAENAKKPLKASLEERELNATRTQIRTCVNALVAEDDKISRRLEAMHEKRKEERGGS